MNGGTDNAYEFSLPAGRGEGVEGAGGTRVAMSDDPLKSGAGDTVRYFVTDHLGSTTRLINTDGSEYSEMMYLSWGSDRLAPSDIGTDFKYTGQREAEAGLYFYNARWYDPELGRFIQADTIIPSPGNPLAWDRYAYTLNNPVNYTDPTGHRVWDGCTGDTAGCNLTELEKNTQAANQAILERQVQIYSCSNGLPGIYSAGDYVAKVHNVFNENKEIFPELGSKTLDLLDLLKGVKLPLISYMIDLEAQEQLDSNKTYTANQKAIRSQMVAVEGQFISWISVGAGGIVLGSTSFVPVTNIALSIGVYASISITLEEAFNDLNEQRIFPVINKYIE